MAIQKLGEQAPKRLKATAKPKPKKQTAAATALPKDVQTIVADYDDVDGVVQGMKKALKAFGITVNEFDSGSDAVCLALSKTKLTKKQLEELFNDE